MTTAKIEHHEASTEAALQDYQGASTEAIQHHYDVGNEFYQLWLDSTLTYSCALWEENDTLETAQLRKLDYYITQARAPGAERVLDIGCGWGSNLRRLVETHGVKHATGLTLSQAQHDRIRSLGDSRIDVRLENWFEHSPEQPYDAIISIAAFEAFAKHGLSEAEKIEAYRSFFEHCHSWLKPGGWLTIQTIIYENFPPDAANPFVSEIFPESDLPHLTEIAAATERIFEVVKLRNDREHYARTLKTWLSNLKANRDAAVELVGEAIVTKYEKYLSVFVIGFHTGTVNLSRLTMRRIDRPRR